jgi:2,4-dichlorophenol 6-monooxygenase
LTKDGTRISTHDLARASGGFVLFIDEAGKPWADALAGLPEDLRSAITVVEIGEGADYRDAEETWSRLAGVGKGGAVLVRPDNHVAWRAVAGSSADAVTHAIYHVLAR